MNDAANGKKTLQGAIDLLAQKAERLIGLNGTAESLLLKLIRLDKSPRQDPGRGDEPNKKPTMVDILYLIAEDMERSINSTTSVLVEINSMID